MCAGNPIVTDLLCSGRPVRRIGLSTRGNASASSNPWSISANSSVDPNYHYETPAGPV
jgi:hypothetical protein